ncbi:MAG: hypothetical protein JRE40_00145 [Deltaproteobacteria bacterium]|nr:hypothetical protein [Deltaproteobacteria bacterium]
MTDLPKYVTDALDKANMELVKIPMSSKSMVQVAGLFGELVADVANSLIKIIKEHPTK